MAEVLNEIETSKGIDLPRRKQNCIGGFFLALLVFFFSFSNPQLELPAPVEAPSISVPAPLESPALEASQAIKFVSREHGVFKLANGNDGDGLDIPFSKIALSSPFSQKQFGQGLFYQFLIDARDLGLYFGAIQPRAPPVIFT